MRILMVTAEFAPYAKTGGLADMVRSLSLELCRAGNDVRVLLPFHGFLPERYRRDLRPLPGIFSIHLGEDHWARLHECVEPGGLRIYFLEYEKFFGRDRPYDDGYRAYEDNPRRFALLSRAAIDLADFLDWTPDIFHAHDWMAAPVPVYLETVARSGRLGRSASVLTIHNLAHQGYAPPSILDYAGLPGSLFRPDAMEACGGINFLKGGIYFANKLTAVSPTYAREIQGVEQGFGLQDALRFRSGDLLGILNGIDDNLWNPATDPLIGANYSSGDLRGKEVCKKNFLRARGMARSGKMPLFGVIGRLYGQKGLDVLASALPRIFGSMAGVFALLGAGDPALEDRFRSIGASYPGRIFVHIGYDEALAHEIEAASDFFLMPSRFEPCGLNQLYSLRYGTLPIVRGTGGLRDTVIPYDEATGAGTGFVFDHLDENSLHDVIGWATSTYYDRPKHMKVLIRRAMAMDFSWKKSVERYGDCYRWALEMKRRP